MAERDESDSAAGESSPDAHVRGADPELTAILEYRRRLSSGARKFSSTTTVDISDLSPMANVGRRSRAFSNMSADSHIGDAGAPEQGLRLWRCQLMAALYGESNGHDDDCAAGRRYSTNGSSSRDAFGIPGDGDSDGSSIPGGESNDSTRVPLLDKDYDGDYEDDESDADGEETDASSLASGSSASKTTSKRGSLDAVADAIGHVTSMFSLTSWTWGEATPERRPLAEWEAAAWGVIFARPASADNLSDCDVHAWREALGPALSCALRPPEGDGVAVAVEFFKVPCLKPTNGVTGTLPGELRLEDEPGDVQVEYAFEVLVEDRNDSEPFRAALEVEAACGGARRLLPNLAERLTDVGKAVPRCLRVLMDSERPCDSTEGTACLISRSRLRDQWLANRNSIPTAEAAGVLMVPRDCHTVTVQAGTRHSTGGCSPREGSEHRVEE